MIRINLSKYGDGSHSLIPTVNLDKVEEAGHQLNIIISIAYASLVNTSTYFLVDYLSQIKSMKICRGKLKSYINRTKDGMKKFDRNFKYEFTSSDIWQKNIDITDCIYEKLYPVCKKMYYSISNELGKTIKSTEYREMLSNMIVSAILLRQSTILFDEVMDKARKETGYNYRPYFEMLSTKCIEYPFSQAFMIIAQAYDIDAEAITKTEHVRNGIRAIVNIMGDENTYSDAKNIVENEEN